MFNKKDKNYFDVQGTMIYEYVASRIPDVVLITKL
jgi:hypothetical protein